MFVGLIISYVYALFFIFNLTLTECDPKQSIKSVTLSTVLV